MWYLTKNNSTQHKKYLKLDYYSLIVRDATDFSVQKRKDQSHKNEFCVLKKKQANDEDEGLFSTSIYANYGSSSPPKRVLIRFFEFHRVTRFSFVFAWKHISWKWWNAEFPCDAAYMLCGFLCFVDDTVIIHSMTLQRVWGRLENDKKHQTNLIKSIISFIFEDYSTFLLSLCYPCYSITVLYCFMGFHLFILRMHAYIRVVITVFNSQILRNVTFLKYIRQILGLIAERYIP